MDKTLIFYIIVIAIINIAAILFFLFGAMKLIFKYIKEEWWFVAIIIPTLIAMPLCAGAVSFYISLLAEVGLLP